MTPRRMPFTTRMTRWGRRSASWRCTEAGRSAAEALCNPVDARLLIAGAAIQQLGDAAAARGSPDKQRQCELTAGRLVTVLQSSARARPRSRQREAPKGRHLPSQQNAGSGAARSVERGQHSKHVRIRDGAAALVLANADTGRHIQRAGSVVEVLHDALGVARQQAAARASAQRCCS